MQRAWRLRENRDFVRVRSRGRSWAHPLVVLVTARGPDAAAPTRIGVSAGKRVGKAVVRNRARRRLKEAARLTLPGLGVSGFDLVLIGRDGTGKRPFGQLIGDLRGALKQAGVLP